MKNWEQREQKALKDPQAEIKLSSLHHALSECQHALKILNNRRLVLERILRTPRTFIGWLFGDVFKYQAAEDQLTIITEVENAFIYRSRSIQQEIDRLAN